MIKYIKQSAKSPLNILLKLNAYRKISHLYDNNYEILNLLSTALEETLKNNVTPDEKVWVDKIEHLRKELNSSSSSISIADYGAGIPSLSLTDKEMYNGKIITKIVGELCKDSSKPYFWSLLLFKLIRKI